jgi:molybdopterin molybdotransferase
MLELEDAVQRIVARIPPPIPQRLSLRECCGRFLVESILATLDLPPFDNSSMDGYAVRAEDLVQAASGRPVALALQGKLAAGDASELSVNPGGCIRVFTGSRLPSNANAVVMQEETRVSPALPGRVEFLEGPKPWENIRFRGEDVKKGRPIAAPGTALTASRLSLLSSMGIGELTIARRPTVGLLATGSELVEAGETLRPGQLYESNRAALSPLIENAGGTPKIYPIVRDDLKLTREALEQAWNECDLVISCGGVSVGEMDFVKTAFEQLGGRLDFWKVAIKPGRPFVFGECNSRFLFGLPRNPVSAFVTFLLLARPAIRRWQGATDVSLRKISGTLAEAFNNPGNRRHFVRVRVDGSGRIHSAGIQASHMLSSLAEANGLLDLAPQAQLSPNDTTQVLVWD